ncbi:ATP:cob(I)alamin adenosyltransferase, partial [Aquitalea sp. S1-19]|nr:ATP:cob(I)alamin adenosyltransferase [Aquitalea sp. S1-19]MCP9761192.1 ATP:cob(I)alamin adenosyltransferase [Aquitalea sp. S1-19]
MGNRLSKIMTRTGDDGTTGLGDGSRLGKESPRIAALGDVDELNCCMGLLLAESLPEHVAVFLGAVQHDLFDLGSELAVPGYSALKEGHVARLEQFLTE